MIESVRAKADDLATNSPISKSTTDTSQILNKYQIIKDQAMVRFNKYIFNSCFICLEWNLDHREKLISKAHVFSYCIWLQCESFCLIIFQDMLSKSERCVAQHQTYHDSCNSFVHWLRAAREKLATCSDTFGEKSTIMGKIERAKVYIIPLLFEIFFPSLLCIIKSI